MLRSGVEVDAYAVHTTLDGLIQRVLELCLVYIVLILSDTDALGIDLDEFGEGIHQPTAYGDGTTNGHILVREFLTGNL
jgi:hypothetical protein